MTAIPFLRYPCWINECGNWELVQAIDSEANPETTEVYLASLDCRFPLAPLYENVEMENYP